MLFGVFGIRFLIYLTILIQSLKKKMAFKQKIYISGPRMGTNNSMYGIELPVKKKKAKSKKTKRKK